MTTYLFDLTTTEDELENLVMPDVDEKTLGIVRKANGSLNIRQTVFTIAKAVASNSYEVPVDIATIAGWCFEYEIEISDTQIACALASLKRSGKLWRYPHQFGFYLPSPHTADYDRRVK